MRQTRLVPESPTLRTCYEMYYFILFTSRYLTKDLRGIVDNVWLRDSFFAHVENILLAMMFDEKIKKRYIAFS